MRVMQRQSYRKMYVLHDSAPVNSAREEFILRQTGDFQITTTQDSCYDDDDDVDIYDDDDDNDDAYRRPSPFEA